MRNVKSFKDMKPAKAGMVFSHQFDTSTPAEIEERFGTSPAQKKLFEPSWLFVLELKFMTAP